jgi:AbrB family looped-hinge helix DNA binding protein
MEQTDSLNEVRLSAQGRVVIPAGLRKALHLKPGDRLIARQDGESIVLERRDVVQKRLQARFSHIPKDISLAEELIADRRAEARREAGE